MSKWHGGKGSKRRPEDSKKLDANWEKIFGKNNNRTLLFEVYDTFRA
jgi:hypothetical protein